MVRITVVVHSLKCSLSCRVVIVVVRGLLLLTWGGGEWGYQIWGLKTVVLLDWVNIASCRLVWSSHLLVDHIKLLVHFLLDERYLILLQILLRRLWGVRIKDVHSLEIESTDASHECLFQVILHRALHSVTLLNLKLGIIESFSKHFDFFTIVGTNRLDLMLNGFFEIFLLFLFTIGQVWFYPVLPD